MNTTEYYSLIVSMRRKALIRYGKGILLVKQIHREGQFLSLHSSLVHTEKCDTKSHQLL
jgi:hypothetical protein